MHRIGVAYAIELNPDFHGPPVDGVPTPFYRVRLLASNRFSQFIHTRCTSVEQARKLMTRTAPGAVECASHEDADAYVQRLYPPCHYCRHEPSDHDQNGPCRLCQCHEYIVAR